MSCVFSQDIITKRDNSELKVKVIEIDEKVVKYKPFDFLEGPMRSIPLSEIARIVYEGGRVENFTIVEVPKNIIPESTASPFYPNMQSSQTFSKNKYPFASFAKLGVQMWHQEDLSEFFGTNLIYAVGIEKQVAGFFKIGAELDFASKTKDGETLRYNSFGAFAKIGWGEFGKVVAYNQIGVKGVLIEDKYESTSELFSGIGISLILGVEFPVNNNIRINLAWDSFLSRIRLEEGSLNTGSEIISGGIIVNF